MNVAEKSTGQLIDETVTSALRMSHAREYGLDERENFARAEALINALDHRLGDGVGSVIFELTTVLHATWVSQEIVMGDHDNVTTATAARQAQRLNAHRSRLIRRIDRLLDEDGITVLTKTYDWSG